MSWIAGWLAIDLPVDAFDILSPPPPTHTPLLRTGNRNLAIVAGGNPDTLIHQTDRTNDQATTSDYNWIVAGLGLNVVGARTRLLSVGDWGQLLDGGHAFDPTPIDGHFVVVRWRGSEVEVYSDQLGQRTMFFAQTGRGIFFSTRLDWISMLAGRSEPDFSQLGSRWRYVNQFSTGSGVKGVDQLGPAGRCRMNPTTVNIKSSPWVPAWSEEISEDQYRSHLNKLVKPAIDGGRHIALGLSGGLDSRTLLALLLSSGNTFGLYVFGDSTDPDVSVAKAISKSLNRQITHFSEPVPEPDACLELISQYASASNLCEPSTSGARQRYFSQLNDHKALMMDGGFGELSRRQYLNRLRLRGRKALALGNPRQMLPFLRVVRADFFVPEVLNEMEEGACRQLQEVLDAMPRSDEIGAGNYLDLLALRTRVPNWGCHEQARLDGLVVNYMPFVQPSLLKILFEVPGHQRKSGRLFRKILHTFEPSLTKRELVKGGTTYPFVLGPVGAWAWTKVKSKMGPVYHSGVQREVLQKLKSFVLDTLHSTQVGSSGLYDVASLARTVMGYYNGEERLAGRVDWWLTFELWRRGLSGLR